MTEAEWLASESPDRLLCFLEGRVSERCLRLFSAACCRRIGHLLSDARSRAAVDVAERLADHEASAEEVQAVRAAADEADTDAFFAAYRAESEADFCLTPEYLTVAAERHAAGAASRLLVEGMDGATVLVLLTLAAEAVWCTPPPNPGIEAAAYREALAETSPHKGALQACREARDSARQAVREAGRASEQAAQTDLLRHCIGNPFRPDQTDSSWSATIIALAQAVYDQEPCSFALRDALLETGHAELAEHFLQPLHPKGCFALDLLLGRR